MPQSRIIYRKRVCVAGSVSAVGYSGRLCNRASVARRLAKVVRQCAGLIVACVGCGLRLLPAYLIRVSCALSKYLTVDGASLTADEPLTVDGAAWCGV